MPCLLNPIGKDDIEESQGDQAQVSSKFFGSLFNCIIVYTIFSNTIILKMILNINEQYWQK